CVFGGGAWSWAGGKAPVRRPDRNSTIASIPLPVEVVEQPPSSAQAYMQEGACLAYAHVIALFLRRRNAAVPRGARGGCDRAHEAGASPCGRAARSRSGAER